MLNIIFVLCISFFSAFFMWKVIDESQSVGFALLSIAAIFAVMYGTAKFVADDVSLRVLFMLAYAVDAYGVCINALAVKH